VCRYFTVNAWPVFGVGYLYSDGWGEAVICQPMFFKTFKIQLLA